MNVGTIFDNVAGTEPLTSLGSMNVAEATATLTERFAVQASAQPGPGQQQLFAHSASQPTGFDAQPAGGATS